MKTKSSNGIRLHAHTQAACSKIAPLWPLSHFVAVNPFVGFADQRFARVATSAKRIQGADTVLPRSWFKAKFEAGDIGMEDLRAAIGNAPEEARESFAFHGETLSPERLVELLGKAVIDEPEFYQTCSFSTYLDSRTGTGWQHVIREETAKWCAAYDDEGQSSWKFPWKHLSLYAGWKEAAQIDRNPELNGLLGFRDKVKAFPEDPEQAIAEAVALLEMPEERIEELLYRILLALPGWAGHLRYKDRELELRGSEGGLLVQLLAILLNYEVALYWQHLGDENLILGWRRNLLEDPEDTGTSVIAFDLAQRLIWQQALESAFELGLRTGIEATSGSGDELERPDVQAVFCIDVRSEVFRRALESTPLKVQTIGFAGFFGLPIEHGIPGLDRGQARCPVLLAPPLKSKEGAAKLSEMELSALTFTKIEAREKTRAWKRFREAASSCFTFVETIGLSYAVKIWRDAFGRAKKGSVRANGLPPGFAEEPDVETLTDLAMGILKGLGLGKTFGKLVLFCGHGSETKNNPYGSGLDCGACGGHAGDANARLAASLLNRADVRSGLAEQGVAIPEDTRFIAGLHNTTTDTVELFDVEDEDPELLAQLRVSLEQAGAITAMERAVRLSHGAAGDRIVSAVRDRSADWAQTRPEWGLAGNAAFVVAPRSWTRSANLASRAFLHDYDASSDPGADVLESIIGGPLVVGSWINLQYYGSATDNGHFGSGHKGIHNVVGGVGVALGNENDLRPGLPWQSVHDGEKLVHEPLRLHACIAAEPEVIDGILERQAHVRHLVENGWIHLIALGAEGEMWARRQSSGGWRRTAFRRERAKAAI